MSGTDANIDYGMVGDLLATIDYDPTSIEPRRLLAQHYAAVGWNDAAADETREILKHHPGDEDAVAWLVAYLHTQVQTDAREGASLSTPLWRLGASTSAANVGGDIHDLEVGYKELMREATDLAQELQAYQDMCSKPDFTGQAADMKAISEGRLTTVIKVKASPSARAAANKIKKSQTPLDATFADLETNTRWIRSQAQPQDDSDKLRDSVLKRSQAIKAALPKSLSHIPEQAFTHIEHELLGKTYQNERNETMYGDPISQIPRSKFWASEDGFAWDMSELATALETNKGVMRNPLSKAMFTASDVKSIVQHPLCKHLAALQLKQQQLINGVRKETIGKLDEMAKVLLGDQSDDAARSREAVDEFLSYSATLPDEEQVALKELRVPGKDSHTGKEYDASIGETVDDAKANRQCFHKTGDLLSQAAKYLRSLAK